MEVVAAFRGWHADPMDIAIPIFDRFTALDAVGPYEVLSRLPGARVRFVAHEAGPVRADTRMLTLDAEARFEDVPSPEVLVVPGGFGTRALLEDERLLDWIRAVHETSVWTTSVCTGSLLLAATGLLDGLDAATHWGAWGELGKLGVRPTARRVVEEGKIITAAGVSSGIDMALTLAARIAGDDIAKAIQLEIEYDPRPPFDAGSPEAAGEDIVALVRKVTAHERENA
jgi:putative intracellular protease/amidase